MHFDFALNSPTIWVFLAVLIFLFLLGYAGIHKKIASSLDARSEKIRDELKQASLLREEAQQLLTSYKNKQKEAENQAKNIIKQARLDAENMAKTARKEFEDRLKRREEQAEAKIKAAEAQAMRDVKLKAADTAISAVEKILRSGDVIDHDDLIKTGISELDKISE